MTYLLTLLITLSLNLDASSPKKPMKGGGTTIDHGVIN